MRGKLQYWWAVWTVNSEYLHQTNDNWLTSRPILQNSYLQCKPNSKYMSLQIYTDATNQYENGCKRRIGIFSRREQANKAL